MLEANLFRSCARFWVPTGCREDDEPFSKCEGMAIGGIAVSSGDVESLLVILQRLTLI